MISGRLQIQQPKSKVVQFTGGLNTQVANLQLTPGELIDCLNYTEREGKYAGYQSIKGYERFDGQTAPSSVSTQTYTAWANGDDYDLWDAVSQNSLVYYCIQASGSGSNAPPATATDNTWWKYYGTTTAYPTYIDAQREATRTAITAVTGDGSTGAGSITGIHIYKDIVYTWRDESDDTETALWKSSASGWDLVDNTSMTEPNCTVKAINGRFSLYASNAEIMFWVDGVTAFLYAYNGTTVTKIATPDSIVPMNLGIFKNRMFLTSAGGHIYFSEVGDPSATGWDADTGYAGEIFIGEDITDIVTLKDILVIFTRNNIRFLHYGSTSDEFIFDLKEFSNNTGAISNSVATLLNHIYFGDDRGIASLGPAPNYDGFISSIIGNKVEVLFRQNRNNIVGSAADLDYNRYYLFYTSGGVTHALVSTFNDNKLKGTTKIELLHQLTCVTEGKFSDGTSKIFFGATNGFVYQLNSGTSMDGTAITTRFKSSYYNYGSPRNWKFFDRISFEIDCASDSEFTIGKNFDYGTSDLAKVATHDVEVDGGASLWGSGILWGSFTWAAGSIGKAVDYIQAYGTNMSITFATSSKYATQHTVHNALVDYNIQSMRQ